MAGCGRYEQGSRIGSSRRRVFGAAQRTASGPNMTFSRTDPFSPATRAAPATTNLEKRLEPRASKRLGQFRDCTVGQGYPVHPSMLSARRVVLNHDDFNLVG
jgi:hypothetical protein